MSDQEKFQAFKEEMIEKNEEKYGQEIRQKYGDQPIDASNRKIMDMSQEQWDQFQRLEATVLKKTGKLCGKWIQPGERGCQRAGDDSQRMAVYELETVFRPGS